MAAVEGISPHEGVGPARAAAPVEDERRAIEQVSVMTLLLQVCLQTIVDQGRTSAIKEHERALANMKARGAHDQTAKAHEGQGWWKKGGMAGGGARLVTAWLTNGEDYQEIAASGVGAIADGVVQAGSSSWDPEIAGRSPGRVATAQTAQGAKEQNLRVTNDQAQMTHQFATDALRKASAIYGG